MITRALRRSRAICPPGVFAREAEAGACWWNFLTWTLVRENRARALRYTIERARGSVADLTLAERSTIVDTLAVLGREGDVAPEAAMEIVAVRSTDTGKRPREPTCVLQRSDRLVGRCREGERCAEDIPQLASDVFNFGV